MHKSIAGSRPCSVPLHEIPKQKLPALSRKRYAARHGRFCPRAIATPPQSTGTTTTNPTPKITNPDQLPCVDPEPQWPPKRPFAAILLDQLLDSVADVGRHIGRMRPLPEIKGFERLVEKGGGKLQLEQQAAIKKPVVLVLGSGWGAHAVIKVIDTDAYDVICVSPRNHFVFTPMLPSTAVGTVEFRSLLEPIRVSNPFVTYFEASCDSLDVQNKLATCTSSFTYDDGRRPVFEVPYDILVLSVGEQPATFGVPGVQENCFFMKEITDCVQLRKKIGEQFELCALPGTSEQDRRKALHFVVVGGGPTGVEFAGTLSDFLNQDLRKKYPELMQYVRVTLLQDPLAFKFCVGDLPLNRVLDKIGSPKKTSIQSGQGILTQFDAKLQQRALEVLENAQIEVRTGVRVVEVTRDQVCLKGGEKLDYGICVWSTGNAPRPIVQDLINTIPEQKSVNASAGGSKLAVDPFLRVIGAEDILAIGDCTWLLGNRLPATAQVAGQQGAYVAHLVNGMFKVGHGGFDQPPPVKILDPSSYGPSPLASSSELRRLAQFVMGGENRIQISSEVKACIDTLEVPSWAQYMTRPQGTGSTPLSTSETTGRLQPVEFYSRPFEFLSLGIMAYVGNDKALTQVEAFDTSVKLSGNVAFLLWKGVYITKQVSFRNRVLILFDWLKAQVFGRDISLF